MDFFQQFQKHENPFVAAKKPRFEPASADDQLRLFCDLIC